MLFNDKHEKIHHFFLRRKDILSEGAEWETEKFLIQVEYEKQVQYGAGSMYKKFDENNDHQPQILNQKNSLAKYKQPRSIKPAQNIPDFTQGKTTCRYAPYI